MAEEYVVDVDLAEVFDARKGGKYLTTLGWGDHVQVINILPDAAEIEAIRPVEQENGSVRMVRGSGFIRAGARRAAKDVVRKKKDNRVLKIDFIDVQQGDASIIETPLGKSILVDGGDNQLFARYLANRFRNTSVQEPKEIDCIVVSHGDADHFQGLTKIHESETHSKPWKRLFIHPARVYHNGLVKGPTKQGGKVVPESQVLGETTKLNGSTYITGLQEDLLKVDPKLMNAPFREWQEALKAFDARGGIQFKRLEQGTLNAFDFLDAGISVDVLGPITKTVNGKKGLRFLGNPPKGPRLGHQALSLTADGFGGLSAAHTINGHSVVLRMKYGNVRVLLTGDLNDEEERTLTQGHEDKVVDLNSEVFKVPHHGSSDFSAAFLRAVSPVVSVVSSGDESARKEYIHPKSTLMGALGKFSRTEEPLIFVTELVAFFQMEGYVCPEFHKLDKDRIALISGGKAVVDGKAKKEFFAFSRAAFGITMVRTDGERLLVYTNSGQTKLKEAYAYLIDQHGTATPTAILKV